MSLDHGDIKREEMAKQLEYSPAQLSRWMADDGKPRRTVIVQWAMLTGVPLEWLESGQDSRYPKDPGGGEACASADGPTAPYVAELALVGAAA